MDHHSDFITVMLEMGSEYTMAEQQESERGTGQNFFTVHTVSLMCAAIFFAELWS